MWFGRQPGRRQTLAVDRFWPIPTRERPKKHPSYVARNRSEYLSINAVSIVPTGIFFKKSPSCATIHPFDLSATSPASRRTPASWPSFGVHCSVELDCAHVHAASSPIRPHGGRFASYACEIRDERMPSGASMVPAAISTTSGSSRSNSSSVVPHATQKCLVAWSEDAHLAVDPLVDRDERAPLTQAWNADPELRRQISQEHRATSVSMEHAYVTVPHAHRPVTA